MNLRLYPQIIGWIDPDLCNLPRHKKMLRPRPSVGGIDTEDLKHDDPIRLALQQKCKAKGFVFCSNSAGPYSDYDYSFGAGSVFTHTDTGMGLTAGVLVAATRLVSDDGGPPYGCELIANGKALDLSIGTAFVFNADKPHAWLANCCWLIALQHVRRKR